MPSERLSDGIFTRQPRLKQHCNPQDNQGHHRSRHIVRHNAQTAVQILVKPTDGGRFERVKQTEQNKCRQPPRPPERHKRQHKHHRDNLVPNNPTVVADTRFTFRISANAYTPNKQHGAQQCQQPSVHTRQYQHKRQRQCRQSAECARRKRSQPAAETECQKTQGTLPQPRPIRFKVSQNDRILKNVVPIPCRRHLKPSDGIPH